MAFSVHILEGISEYTIPTSLGLVIYILYLVHIYKTIEPRFSSNQ